MKKRNGQWITVGGVTAVLILSLFLGGCGVKEVIFSGGREQKEYGKAEMLYEESGIALFALGSMVSTGEHVREKLKARGYSCTLVNARFAKPMDTDMLDRLCRNHDLIVTMEENVLRGGLGMCATRYIHEHYPQVKVIQVALPDAYVEHGNVSLLREMLGIDSDSVIRRLEREYLGKERLDS